MADMPGNGAEPMNCKVLVVDADRAVRGAIAEFLTDHGFQADAAEDAKTAVARMKSIRYDIVVMEICLPIYSDDYSGRHLLKYIQNRYPMIKTIVITRDASIETGLESIELGASDWMTKPFSLPTLRNRMLTIIWSQKVLSLPTNRCRNHTNC
jgi:DNA-binding response OmpR family regulator